MITRGRKIGEMKLIKSSEETNEEARKADKLKKEDEKKERMNGWKEEVKKD